jgi:RHS repeat-associated protein
VVNGCPNGGTLTGNQCVGPNSIRTAYIYLGGKQIAETVINGATQYVHTDALGSPVAHTDQTGFELNRTKFEPYGNTAAGTKPGPTTPGWITTGSAIGFTGHVNDPETDLVYMQQRYYDPIAGRFLSIDPVVTDANTGGSFNRYAYANNSPYKYIDPDGRSWALAGRGAVLGAEGGFAVCGPWCSAAGAVIVGGAALYGGEKALTWIASSSEGKTSGSTGTPSSGGNSGTKIEEGKQGKHVPGHNNFEPGKSELTHPNPQSLIDEHKGTGQQVGSTPVGEAGSRERVDFGTNIGVYVDPATGQRSPTTNGIIHESKKGVHIVPARPNDESK